MKKRNMCNQRNHMSCINAVLPVRRQYLINKFIYRPISKYQHGITQIKFKRMNTPFPTYYPAGIFFIINILGFIHLSSQN